MGWESSAVVGFDLGPLLQGQMRMWNQIIGYHDLWPKDGSLALVSLLSGGYKFALFLRCIGLVYLYIHFLPLRSYFYLLKHYLDLHITDTALNVSQSLYSCTVYTIMVLKTISPRLSGTVISEAIFCVYDNLKNWWMDLLNGNFVDSMLMTVDFWQWVHWSKYKLQ